MRVPVVPPSEGLGCILHLFRILGANLAKSLGIRELLATPWDRLRAGRRLEKVSVLVIIGVGLEDPKPSPPVGRDRGNAPSLGDLIDGQHTRCSQAIVAALEVVAAPDVRNDRAPEAAALAGAQSLRIELRRNFSLGVLVE
jgi:hypothetical protein